MVTKFIGDHEQVYTCNLPSDSHKLGKNPFYLAVDSTEAPVGHARWTLRLLAGKLVQLGVVDEISHETVRRTLKKTS